MRNGHSRVFEYGYSFVKVCAEELREHESDLRYERALSVRLAGTSEDNWKKFSETYTKKAKKAKKEAPVQQKKNQMTLEEHRAIARRLAGI